MCCQCFCQTLSADPCQQRKLSLSYPMAHVLVIDCGYSGHRPSDHFLPSSISFATFLSCTSCAISPSLASHPNLLPLPHAPWPDTSPSPACSFLGWLFLLSFPKAATGSKTVNQKLAEENHLTQPQTSTESLKAGSLKHQAMEFYQDQTDLAKAHNLSRLSWISRVAKALLPNFMLFLRSTGPLGLSEDEVDILFNVKETYICWRAKAFWLKFLYTVWDNSWYKHTCITRPTLGRRLLWKKWALVAEDWQWHQQWKMWSNSRNYQAAFNRWVFPMPP